MTAPLPGLDSPAIRPSFFGGWLVDDGGIVPVRAATWRVARAEAAARSLISPPIGDSESSRPVEGSRPVATAGVVGASDSQSPNRTVGQAPGSSAASPGGHGPGALNVAAGHCGRPADLAADTAGVGAGVRANTGSARTPAGDIENGEMA